MSDISYSAIILAAGEGSRLVTNGVPRFFKPLLQVNRKFLIEHSLDFARQWGVEKEIIVTSAVLKSILSESVSKDSIYYLQPEPTGLMDAIRIAMKSVCSDWGVLTGKENIIE
jgi:dTDP-glucose pyrophosphorylase